LASASGDSTVRVWDVESGECLAVLAGHGVAVNSVAYAPDGKRLASAAHDNTVRVWDVENGECLTVLTGHKKTVNSVAYAPDGQRLASASYDGTVRVWDVESGECLTIMKGHTDWVNSVAYAPDGQQLSSASWDGSLRKWDITSGSEIHQTHFFKGGAWVTLDVENNSIVQVAGNAWRWIGWSGIDQATGCLERWPAEIYGPLPEWQSNKN
jgi:WD40 repeat protein